MTSCPSVVHAKPEERQTGSSLSFSNLHHEMLVSERKWEKKMTEKDCLKDGKGDVREQERGHGKRMEIYRNIEKWKNSLREIE